MRMNENRQLAFVYAVIVAFGVIVLAVAFSSCTAVKTATTDKSVTEQQTQTTERIVRDTLYIDRVIEVEKQSATEQKASEDTEIIFAEGGGTYNALTGAAEGVKSVKTSKREELLQRELERSTEQLRQQQERIEVLSDSIQTLSQHNDIVSTEERTPKNYWWVWFVGGIVLGAGVLIALKKIPYTKPFMLWL